MPNLRPIEFLMIAAVILILVAVVYSIVRAASHAGVKAEPRSQMATPSQPLDARLAELTDLRSRGVISEDEYKSARASALQQA